MLKVGLRGDLPLLDTDIIIYRGHDLDHHLCSDLCHDLAPAARHGPEISALVLLPVVPAALAVEPLAVVSARALPGHAAEEACGLVPVFGQTHHPAAVAASAGQPGPPAALDFSSAVLPAYPAVQVPVLFVLSAG